MKNRIFKFHRSHVTDARVDRVSFLKRILLFFRPTCVSFQFPYQATGLPAMIYYKTLWRRIYITKIIG